MYATLATPGTKKVSVCARRLGSRERLSVIAQCNDEGTAEKIVDALNVMQGKLEKLEVPAQRVLEEVRGALGSERLAHDGTRRKVRELESQLREKSNEIGQLRVEFERERRTWQSSQAPAPAQSDKNLSHGVSRG
jgi:predicted RNase H-like nuclease (RuvC/YqgF family)